MTNHQKTSTRPNCFACRYFYITHEPKHPYGCQAMGFKSKNSPALAVFQSSGLDCQVFEKKNNK